jgi:hypothetical protein
MKRICPECQEEFTGRSDKVYCSDACRSAFHNRKNAEETIFMRSINKILRDNRNVLEQFNPDGKASVKREKLIDRGFKFRYFTNEYRSKNGNLYHFCYDYGVLITDSDWVTIVKRQEYVE